MADARRPKPPRWTTLARFEGRITEAQMTKLKALTRKLTVSKRRERLDDPDLATERITDNTLIRVAVELLFLFGSDLSGYTEPELIDSAKATVKRLRSDAAAYKALPTPSESQKSPEQDDPSSANATTDNPWGE